MYFNSFQYVLFLWTVYVLYWTLQNKRSWRHTMVLVASYWFYAQADWRFTFLLAISSVVDWFAGRGIQRAGERQGPRRFWLGVSLVANLGMLGTFKYYDFFVDSFEALFAGLGTELQLQHLGAAQGGWLDYVVPAGISFYTFQTLSYTFDIYKRRLEPCRHFLDFATYVSFFPQLVAGPIVRARDFLPQLESPAAFDSDRVASGLFQILRGMTKKLLMADILGVYLVDVAFAHDPARGLHAADTIAQLGAPTLMVVMYGYALQLYGDFAGYSDIAIGSARLLGFELRKNFDAPYRSKSPEEFWSRWHISMSSWFMDYVYIGLGGSRVSLFKTVRNVLVAWTLVGLWHGAAWTFVLWGFYHGAWLGIVRLVRLKLPGGKVPGGPVASLLGVVFTFHVVLFSMILFRCPDMETFWTACRELFDWGTPLRSFPPAMWTILALGYVTHLMPEAVTNGMERGFQRLPTALQGVVVAAAIAVFFLLAPPQAPFIYFNF